MDGKWKKKDFQLTAEDYPQIVERFLASAARIQAALIADTASKVLPAPGTISFQGGLPYDLANTSDTLRGPGKGLWRVVFGVSEVVGRGELGL